jgi:hypothetical protein
MNMFGQILQSRLHLDSSIVDDEENDCNVIDEEEEALDALKTRQAEQTQKLKESSTRQV